MRRLLQLKHPLRLFVWPLLSCLFPDETLTISPPPGCDELSVGDVDVPDVPVDRSGSTTSMSSVSSWRNAPKSKSLPGVKPCSVSMAAWWVGVLFSKGGVEFVRGLFGELRIRAYASNTVTGLRVQRLVKLWCLQI